VQIEEHVSLAQFTTLKIGGPARYFVRATDEQDLWDAVHFARDNGLAIFTLGGGSNLVVSDTGFPGLVIHTALEPSIGRRECADEIVFDVSAGTDWDEFVLFACQEGICGVECLAGIPGTVGGAPIQNIGAYGQEVSQSISSVRVLDLNPANGFVPFATISHEQCGFAYRKSIFNGTERNRHIVSSVRFRFSRSATPNLSYADLEPLRESSPSPLDVYAFVRSVRDRKGMLIDPANLGPDSRSAGSFFKNPVVAPKVLRQIVETIAVGETVPRWPTGSGAVKLPAAWLIEQAGFPKGFALGRVGISSKHTLALINRTGDATCADLLQLRDLIVMTVEQRFGVTLEQEPVMLG